MYEGKVPTLSPSEADMRVRKAVRYIIYGEVLDKKKERYYCTSTRELLLFLYRITSVLWNQIYNRWAASTHELQSCRPGMKMADCSLTMR